MTAKQRIATIEKNSHGYIASRQKVTQADKLLVDTLGMTWQELNAARFADGRTMGDIVLDVIQELTAEPEILLLENDADALAQAEIFQGD